MYLNQPTKENKSTDIKHNKSEAGIKYNFHTKFDQKQYKLWSQISLSLCQDCSLMHIPTLAADDWLYILLVPCNFSRMER